MTRGCPCRRSSEKHSDNTSTRPGADWGIIVNPQSERFCQLTFEHDDCGCL
jgi:hypothetical protein